MSKRVLFIGHYGVSLNISIAEIELICGLAKKGLTIDVYSIFNDESQQRFNDAGITTISGTLPSGIDRAFINRIKDLYQKNQYDIIHCYHNRMLRNVIMAIKHTPVKLVTYLGASSVYWHDPSAYLSFLNPRVDAVICNSQKVFKHFKRQLFLPKARKRAVMIYKGYASSWFSNVEPFDLDLLDIPKDAIVVSMACTFSKVKGIEYFVNSADFLPDKFKVYYILMGTNTDNNIVKGYVSKSSYKDRFRLLGHREDVKSVMKASDIYIQSSLKEGFGRSLSEAVNMGIPVILTETGGFAEVITHKENGMIVPIKNPKAIADAIVYMNDKKRRQQMGTLAQQRLKTDFTIQQTIAETYKLYQNLTDS